MVSQPVAPISLFESSPKYQPNQSQVGPGRPMFQEISSTSNPTRIVWIGHFIYPIFLVFRFAAASWTSVQVTLYPPRREGALEWILSSGERVVPGLYPQKIHTVPALLAANYDRFCMILQPTIKWHSLAFHYELQKSLFPGRKNLDPWS